MLAKKYALQGRKKLALRWAEISEKAWLSFLKIDANWYNSYHFYAMALGYQDRLPEAEQAFAKAAKIAGQPKNWKAVRKDRDDMMQVHAALYAK